MRHPGFRRPVTLAATILTATVNAHATFPGGNGAIVYGDGQYINRIAADGSGSPTRLIQGDNPKVSPDGRRVAFTRRNPYWNEVHVIGIDGSGHVLLHVGNFPAWSPDGNKLAYYVDAGTSGNSAIDVFDTTTAQRKRLGLVHAYGGPVDRLDWSPTGEQLVYSLSGVQQTFTMNATTGAINDLSIDLLRASWFPDATALVGVLQGTNCVYRIGNGGGQLQQLACHAQWPTVSPDGASLLTVNAATPASAGALMARPIAGGAARTIASSAVTADWSRVPLAAMHTARALNQWPAPTPLGNDPSTYIAQIEVAVMPDHGTQGQAMRRAVGIGVDGRVYERAQALNTNWGAWTLVPGYAGHPPAEGIRAKKVAVAGARNGSLQVVVVGSNDLVYHAMRYANGNWSGFGLLDGANGAANFAARDVAIAIVNSSIGAPGQAHVAATGLQDGPAAHRVRLDNGSWTPWGLLSGEIGLASLAMSFADNADLYLVATSPTKGVVRQLRRASGAWDGWLRMSTDVDYPLADVSLAMSTGLDNGQPSSAWVAFVTPDGTAHVNTVTEPSHASSWARAPVPVTVASPVCGVSIGNSEISGLEMVLVQPRPQ